MRALPVLSLARAAQLALLATLASACQGKEQAQAAPAEPTAPSASASAAKKKKIDVTPIAKDEGEAPAAPSAAPAVKKPFAVGKFEEIPKEATFEGKIVGGLAWTDAFGDNLAIFTRRESKTGAATSVYLRAYHYANGGSAWTLIREVKDQFEKCEFDQFTGFMTASFKVEDADKNGVGELRFAYTVDCTSDVSPNTAKLLVLEGGAKSILRGKTRVVEGGESYGGSYIPDPAAEQWKKPVLDGARAEWGKLFMGPKAD